MNDLVAALGIAQPQVSKHLKVLREVGLVQAREHGRQRLYRLDGRPLKPIHDWVQNFEQLWTDRFAGLDAVIDRLKAQDEQTPRGGTR